MPTKIETPRLKLELDAAASPSRVALVASMLAEALDATGFVESDSGMTLVIENFNLGATLRPRDPDGKKAVKVLRDVLTNPVLAVQKHDGARDVARRLAAGGRKLLPATTRVLVDDIEIARMDDVLVKALAAVSEPPDVPVETATGTGTLTSPVLRVGKSAERGGVTARIRILDDWADVRVAPTRSGEFFDAAKAGTPHVIRVHGAWARQANGQYELQSKTVTALGIVGPAQGVSGRDLLEMADASDDGILSGTVESIIEELGLDS